MSRNFELLQQAERDRELFVVSGTRPAPTNGKRGHVDLEAFTREERIKLVQRVFLLPGADAPRVVVFCGVEAGDGASWICAHVGETLASQVNGAVCVVDANLRNPSIHRYFRTENLSGLTDAIARSRPARDLARQMPGGRLWILASGSRSFDPGAVLTSKRFRSYLNELRAEFDFVVIDAPAVNLYADAVLLGKLADGTVLVVQANSTRREAARKAKESLESAKVKLIGVVLNKRTFPIPEALYRRF
jgi:capsular exopolysaccharide synthesis family protein